VSGQLEFGEEDRVDALASAWELCLHLLATKVPTVTFESYIRPIVPVKLAGSAITLGVASPYARDWLEKKAANSIRSALEFHLDTTGLQIQFIVLSRDQQEATPRKSSAAKAAKDAAQTALPLDEEDFAPEPEPKPTVAPATTTPRAPAIARGSRKSSPKPAEPEKLPIPSLPLNDRYLFENFLVGRSNRLAHAGAMHVAAKPGEIYNPLFLYSAPGLGKTHLLQGIAHVLRKSKPDARIAYVSGESFAQHYIGALRDHATEAFRRQYRQVDVWLVDDIQFIAGKEHTKEEFFHTFNSLYQGGKQIVLASDRSPRELNTMDERLRSRFQSGLIADIGAPELETRIAILQQCRQREKANVDDEVIEYIASAIQSNIRALEGALTKLIATSSIMKIPVTPELAHDALGEYFIEKPIRSRKITVDDILTAVAEQFGTTAATIKGTSRNKEVSLARHIAMYLCRELMPEVNTRIIGAALAGRDHTTIVHAYQKIRALMEVDIDIADLIKKLAATLSV
jgi:chromosomal replication initiator protein